MNGVNLDKMEELARLLAGGWSMEQICGLMHIGKTTYYRYVNELRGRQSQPTSKPITSISFKCYYNAVMSGECANKDELARRLNVSRRTLFMYEDDGNLGRIAQLLWLRGWDVGGIQILLGIKSKERVNELVAGVASIDDIRRNVEKTRSILGQCSEVDAKLTFAWSALLQVLNKMDEIKKSLE